MKVAFYKVTQQNATALDKVIAWWTSDFKEKFNGDWKLGYSHTEIVFSDGVMISSSPREATVRAKEHTVNAEAWDYIDVSGLDESTARVFAETQLGKAYDWFGVSGFVVAVRDNESKWFCSELSSRILQIAGCVKIGEFNPGRISPNRLYKLLQRR